MWQDPYGIRWAEENGVLYIQGGGKREPFLLPPFAGKDAKFLDGLLRAKEWFVENKLPFRFKGVSKDVKERTRNGHQLQPAAGPTDQSGQGNHPVRRQVAALLPSNSVLSLLTICVE